MTNIFTLTEKAEEQVKLILSDHPGKLLKVGVKSGGCSGLSYTMEMITENDILNDDEIVTKNDLKIVVDGVSVLFLLGTELDYVVDLIGSQFTFNNPQTKASCGCGSSFSI